MLRLFQAQTESGKHVRCHTDDNHLDITKDLRETENDVKQDWYEFGETSRRQQIKTCLLQIVVYETSVFDGNDDRGKLAK